MQYLGQRALVLGLGESGLAMARWLDRCGARVRVADTRANPDRLATLVNELPAVEFSHSPAFGPALLESVNFVAVSPGLSPLSDLAQIESVARARGIPIWSEIELFARALAQLKQEREYQPRVIAVTGTNGKTTVTSLTGLLCRRAGLSTRLAGNISPAALDALWADLNGDSLPQVWVLELSSFQLHYTFSLNADVATVLNITEDHLDWHGDMAAYTADKARIFGPGTVRVLNRDDAVVMRMQTPHAVCVNFGKDEPNQPNCFGLLNDHSMQWLCHAIAEEEGEKKRKRKGAQEVLEVNVARLMPVDALKIRGQHNALNALAALALCRSIELPLAPLLHGLREYQGEAHRVEMIASIAGVEYYDDSKGTNVGATIAALNGLGAYQASEASGNKQIVLIAGGEGKGQNFMPLAEPVAKYVRAVYLIGKDAQSLQATLAETGVPQTLCPTLEAAVEAAAGYAEAGNIVLLSPACASLDMFRNYAHRAQVFADTVREIGLSKGEFIA